MKLVRSFGYALAGIRTCYRSEQNFRIHISFMIVALILSMVCYISQTEWIAVCLCIAFVISMEMLNTAIEKLCDVVHKEVQPDIKKVKDIGAGAVLISALLSAITGAIIFIPKILNLIKTVI